MVIFGLSYMNNLVYIAMINAGTFDAMLSQLPSEQAASMEAIRVALLTTSPAMFLMAGFERILTMVIHVALSLIVCWGVHTGKVGTCLLICLGIHTFIDLTAGISLLSGTVLTQTTTYLLIYAILAAVAVLSILMIRNIRRRWQEVDYVQQIYAPVESCLCCDSAPHPSASAAGSGRKRYSGSAPVAAGRFLGLRLVYLEGQ